MKFLFTIKCECDSYSITINKDIIHNLRNICIKELIIYILEFVLTVLMEIELSQKLGLKKGKHSKDRSDYRSGYYDKTWHTLIGEISLRIPKLRHQNYQPFFACALDFLAEQRRRLSTFSFVAGVTTRMISPLFSLLAIKPVQKSTVSVYNEKYLEEEYLAFCQKDLTEVDCPILMIDALYEDVRIGASLEKAATIVITGIDKYGFRQVLDIAVTYIYLLLHLLLLMII